ncbi:MAG: hypothetical protein ACRED0_12570, partial [Gammaproteobacteria bacterium]
AKTLDARGHRCSPARIIATAGRLIPRLGELTFSGAEIAQISMAAVCLLFVVLAVKSFVGARRKV